MLEKRIDWFSTLVACMNPFGCTGSGISRVMTCQCGL